ncbi:iron-containing alcohol dehydrogenase family protein [Anaerococcus sp. AGMB00486]|uniref:Iron-containing alcohol dehydrogenase family protein n=1 Tax=Anaerococcus faecalis TaxID=2742993 RepID=A0ABX2N8X5_9FIRM|nr:MULTISPECIES: iron-containing alcohol dehydrogenase family protein [Anaerococcus]MDY3007256.1 iron-containing alcohol dehydrogenase family protein [Anaerococcus porci]NVF11156.1 iron-containing alcohol dehydrogenase family protein [Anaerococcus faecalis]
MTSVNLTNYSVSRNNYKSLARVCKDERVENVVIIGGKRAMKAANSLIKEALQDTEIKVLGEFVYGKNSTNSNIEKLLKKNEVKDADVVFAVGGGKAIDTAKVIADRLNKDCYSFPTICSNCSSATAIAVIYNDDGSFSHYEDKIKAPSHIFINIEILAKAPEIYMWAGVGDGLSKEAEVLFAMRGQDLNHVAKLGKAIAKSCQEPFLKYGQQAIEDCKNNKSSKAIEEVAMDIFINTGNVSNLTNQKDFYYNSSLAHAFYNASCSVKREGHFEHGEVVSFGVLVLHAYDRNLNELDKIGRFNKKVGLPTKLSDLNLKIDDLEQIADEAMKTNEWKKAKVELSRENFIEAIKVADQYGKALDDEMKIEKASYEKIAK